MEIEFHFKFIYWEDSSLDFYSNFMNLISKSFYSIFDFDLIMFGMFIKNFVSSDCLHHLQSIFVFIFHNITLKSYFNHQF